MRRQAVTRTGRAAALTGFFQFLELRHRVTCRYPSREGLGVCAPASGRRWSKQLVDEDVLQPLFVPLGGPAPVTDKRPVDLGGRECVDDVVSVALAQLRPQSAGAGEGPRGLDDRGASQAGPCLAALAVVGAAALDVGSHACDTTTLELRVLLSI